MNDPKSWIDARADMVRFQNLYPNDPRSIEIAVMREKVEFQQLKMALTEKINRQDGSSTSPMEEHFLNAVRLAKTDPELAAARLEAYIALNQVRSKSEDENTAHYVILANQQLENLKPVIAKLQQAHKQFIRRKMDIAKSLRDTDVSQAEQIVDSLRQLYSDKNWALDLIDRLAIATNGNDASAARQHSASKETLPPEDLEVLED